MQRVIFTVLFLITFTANAQTFEKKQNDSLKQKVITTFREIYWNNLPSPKGWVNDYERIFSDNEERKLDSIISNFEKETSIEIAIVTIDTIKVAAKNFEDLSLHIAKKWEVGKKGKDNGILIAISKGYRRIRIQTGNGIEKILTNEETGEIIQNYFIPEFRTGNYYQGMRNGLLRIIEVLKLKTQ